MSLYVKFIWFTFLTMLISSAISFFAMNTLYHQFLKEDNNDKNLAIAESFAGHLNSLSPGQVESTLEVLGDAGYQLYLTDGSDISRFGGEFRDETIAQEDVERVLGGDIFNGIRDFPRQTFVTGFFANELQNSIGVPLTLGGEPYALFLRPDIELLFQELHLLFGGLAVGIVLLSFLGMLLIARLLIQPITKLTEATEKMATETFDVPLTIDRKDEIGRLADQFRLMRTRIEQSTVKRKEFVHNVSHDIQSPLHTIQSYLGLLEKPGISDSDKQHYADIIREETARLSLLTTQLLTLASVDKETPEALETVALHEQLHATLSHLRYAFDDKELALSAQLTPAYTLGNAVLLQTVWENLLTNAVKYSEQGGAVDVTLTRSEGYVHVTVRDHGIGMTEDETMHAFDRFYRADQARTRGQKGSGLGLSIAKEIIELHGGQIELDSAPDAGTIVTVTLPVSLNKPVIVEKSN
ncbi:MULTISPECIES: cell wall metabolism sensor histidine kinase WalK [unclassified Planococcus (in: firmicutes)]|uniref:sensor histidine kinase n=1 Tax=Planococcus TaxID=1372 RepID=UPI000C32811E|nr:MULTISPECIES: HAMP domain-containing sensor histidine kinase [unclassified Planococcus (in: firmicutes)]AUD12678.1 sensor histidine kinase [Planococcus sp. MB-3u-03]PKG46794.1 sensor histidine kinase [Planococcus sp. Urea-trap-24]PKG89639.1 sensor histidine kinase [Planococcus sp. Urea-3u-39]PKH36052.1 sensor histidine kinase [Planococcus sp. MB-3u-09]